MVHSSRDFKKFISFFLILLFIVSILPISVFATSNPWDKFSRYIPRETPISKRHLRAVWITTVINLDWPSADTRKIVNDRERIQKSKEELIELLDRAVEMNMNAVFFQVSPEGDAFYKSEIVNWSRYLTGTFGKDPGFDPLTFAIEEARKRNLELHAWFNPYRVSMNTQDSTIASLNIDKSVYREQPGWIKTSMDRFIVDPGIPEAREWVANRVMEVLNNYDVDGIHFDDYFYYERFEGEMKDQDTFNRYNQGKFSNLGDWRRNNTYLLIKDISEKIRQEKPWVKFGISPAGVWGNKSDGLPGGSDTNSSFTNYHRSFADTKKWVEEEIIDYIAPQVYFSFGNSRAPYGVVSDWWANLCRGKNVHLYIGQALYKVNDDTDQYFKGVNAVPEFSRQLKFNATHPQIMGSIMFRYKNLTDSAKADVVDTMKEDLWSTKALVPVMPWKGGRMPISPVQGRLEPVSQGINISWIDNDPDTAYFAIYRINKDDKIDISSDASALSLIATIRKNSNGLQQFIDTTNSDKDKYIYGVTALDRLHNESRELLIRFSQSKYFSDIDMGYSWAAPSIDNFYERKIVFGEGNGLFNPRANTRRGDFILMIVRAMDFKAEVRDNFVDVPVGSYYYEGIGIAKALGIAKGSGGGNFNPNSNITREDVMVIIDRVIQMAGWKIERAGEESLEGYNDAHLISSYARSSVASLTKAGLIYGSGGGVQPKQPATRAEIVVILHRVLSRMGTI